MAAAGIGGGKDHDLPLEEVDAVLASFSGDPATVFPPLPAPEAAASREPVVAGESLREGLGDVEKFIMQDYEDEALDGVDEFLDGILVGDGEGEGEGSPKPTGEKSADRACAGEDEVVVVGVDCGDDPNSKKKRRYLSFFVSFF
jgi:hypothetical protein